jgi:hypothetical protein
LYDSLLDELEDDVVSNPQEVEELTEKVVDAAENHVLARLNRSRMALAAD